MTFNPAPWVRSEHRDALVLTQAYYTEPIYLYNGWLLISRSHRVGLYRKGARYIVVCKGTTPTDSKDIFDDLVIGNVFKGQVTLETDVLRVVKKIPKDHEVTLTGHSLGGYVAMVMAKRLGFKAIVFNPAAPPNKRLSEGPGPENAVVYQISGDLISNNLDSNAAEIIRVNQGYSILDTLAAHTMTNFSAETKTYGFYSEKQQDTLISSSLAYAAALATESKTLQSWAPIMKALKYIPYAYSFADQFQDDKIVVMQSENNPIAFVTPYNNRNNTYVDKQALPKDVDTFADLKYFLSKLGFYSSTTSQTILNSAVESCNSQASKYLPYFPNLSLAQVTLTTTNSQKPPSDLSKLQSIGLTDDVISAIAFASKTENPSQYLEEVKENLDPVPSATRTIQENRLSSYTADQLDVDIEGNLPLNTSPPSSGLAKTVLQKLSDIFVFAPETSKNIENENFITITKQLLATDTFSNRMNASIF